MTMLQGSKLVLLLIGHHAFSFTWTNSPNSPHRMQSSNPRVFGGYSSCLNVHMERLIDTETEDTQMTLPELYPQFGSTLQENGFTLPTPIQKSSSIRAQNGENLLLIAATGSGKTLAYLLPALSRVREHPNERKTVLIVAPTRELAAQLARDASLFLPDETSEDGSVVTPVLLAVRGIPPPNPSEISRASVMIGTPDELYAVLTRISGAQHFISGGTLSNIIMDEVDVLLPPTPKTLRTSFDGGNDAKRERQTLEQRRKLRAAQRRGVEFH
eukprot:scaffold14365_cov21-Cyclotella_meneghiniana.AAC.1